MLSNVVFTGLLTQEETIVRILGSDIGLVTLTNIELFKSAIPSKIFDYMAAGLPVIVGIEGEARELVEKNNAGLYYTSGSPNELAEKIRWLQANKSYAREMGNNGRTVAFNSFSRRILAIKLEEMVTSIGSRKGRNRNTGKGFETH